MNRRRALSHIGWLGGGLLLTYGCLKAYTLYKKPDITFLDSMTPLLNELAETIIPATDTPGAREANAGKAIIQLVKSCSTRPTQNNFIQGLHELIRYARDRYQKNYEDCTTAEKNQILTFFEKTGTLMKGNAGKFEHKFLGDPFFLTLKKYTVIAYCTSREGATKGLKYDYVPGKYTTIEYRQGDKAWATQ